MSNILGANDPKHKRFNLIDAIDNSFSEIQERLGVKITEIQRTKKIYGSNSNVFFVNTTSTNDIMTTYLLKFGRNKSVDDELKGDLCIQGLLNTPRVILSSKKKLDGHEWILYEYIPGRLMSEELTILRDNKKLDDFYKLEKQKELYLDKMHSKTISIIDYANYIKSRGNKLFRTRFLGNRYKDFYENDMNNVSSLFDRTIILNGNKLPLTINQIVDNIAKKYNSDNSANVKAIIGHGDAHHGNILIGKDIWFIDNEYADLTTPFMELAKPYYNDFLGDLFFHHSKLLNEYFKVIGYKDTGAEILIKIDPSKPFVEYIEITKIKLSVRKNTVNKDTEDFLSLNDYLFLCHILTKNPNKYPKTAQKQFILFAVLLSIFDPYNPESIHSYF